MPEGLARSQDRSALSRSSSRAPLEAESEEEEEEEETETELEDDDDDDVIVDSRPPPPTQRQSSSTSGKRPRSSAKSRNTSRSLKVEPEPSGATVVPMTTMEESQTRSRSRDNDRDTSRRSDPPPYSNDGVRRPRQRRESGVPWWKSCCGIFFIVCAILLVLLLIILVPLGYNELEYYEMGFHRNLATGFVDTTKVLYGGRHWVGVNADFVKYPTTIQRECFSNITIFNDEKKQISFSFCLSYLLRAEDLRHLHQTYGTRFAPLVRHAAALAVKQAAVDIKLDDYRRNRLHVAKELEKAAAEAIGGKCCRRDCVNNKCREGCKANPGAECGDDIQNKGYFVVLRHFNLHRIDFSPSETEQFMKRVSEREVEQTTKNEQEEKLVRMRTEQLELEHTFLATQIAQNASAESSRIKVGAVSEAESVVEYWRNQGLRRIYDALNVTEEEYKKSLDYVITLRNQNKANLYMGFRYMVAAESGEPDRG